MSTDKKNVARQLLRLAKELTAATEIAFGELPADRQAFAKRFGGKVTGVYHGIHGYVIFFKGGDLGGQVSKDEIETLAKDKNVRWVETGRGGISVGI